MISKMKVSDGDLLLINLGGNDLTQKHIEFMREKIKRWLLGKGLNNVEIVVTAGAGITIGQLSVNDVFENEVLKGDR